EEIFDRKSRMKIRGISPNPVLRYRINHLLDCLEFEEAATEALKEQIPVYGEPFMSQIEILTGMKGGRKLVSSAYLSYSRYRGYNRCGPV
ncbi:MAG: IS110 family transposase, partial [Spirochaetaceae bacterium]|nr:IS110 family transposase [Spirochaetaceae bacterium]